jgi:hypothetical protein
MGKKMTLIEFIARAIAVHGYKYDYSKVVYVNNRTKVIIICPEHGEFLVTPYSHLNGVRCPKCAHNYPYTTETFIEQSKKMYDENEFDYSKVVYTKSHNRICLIHKCGHKFYVKACVHIRGLTSCPCCRYKIKNTEDFVKLAKKTHGDYYDYSITEYVNTTTKLWVICPIHGKFLVKPYNHLLGNKCPKCVGQYMDTEYFIEKAKKIHGDKYDYSKVIYVDSITPVIIICPIHGEFLQKPNVHLKGHGCSECGSKKNISETKLFNILKKEFINIEVLHLYRNMDILGRKSIDIYLPEYKIAVEYQGRQHFEPVTRFSGRNGDYIKRYEKYCILDKEKYQQCKDYGVKLFYFTYEKSKVPDIYIDKVYTDETELINAIKKHIDKQ